MNKLLKYVGRRVKLNLAGCEGVVCGFYKDELLVDAEGFHAPVRCSLNATLISFLDEINTNAVVPLRIDEMFELVRYNNEMAKAYPVSLYEQKMKSGKTAGEHAKERKARAQWLHDELNAVWPK